MRLRNFQEIDYLLLFSTLALTTIGILFIYSSGMTTEGISISNEYRRQLIWAAAGLTSAVVIAMVNYRRIYDLSRYFYLGTLILLMYTLIFSRVFSGSRWIRIGAFSFQASEIAKLTTIVFLAWYLDNTKRSQETLVRFITSCVIVLVPMVVVLAQPDLGTSLVFVPILLGMTLIAGVPVRYIFFVSLLVGLAAVLLVLPHWQATLMNNSIPVLMALTDKKIILAGCLVLSVIAGIALFGYIRYKKRYFYWIFYAAGILILALGTSFAAHQVLKDYQIMRLIVFLDPNVDPRGSGWHIIQSATAIGSGGLFGKGFLHGTQSQYHYLPEQSTDFIFAILSEEWGFIGGILVFLLFLIINLRLIRIMRTTTDSFGSYIVTGLVSMFAFHFLVNVGMTMGIMPITGIPLLFVSYGGSALLTAMMGIGLALSIYIRRYDH